MNNTQKMKILILLLFVASISYGQVYDMTTTHVKYQEAFSPDWTREWLPVEYSFRVIIDIDNKKMIVDSTIYQIYNISSTTTSIQGEGVSNPPPIHWYLIGAGDWAMFIIKNAAQGAGAGYKCKYR